MTARVQVIDSHTAGEPTRLIVAGGPDLGTGSMAERLKIFREKYDQYRSAVIHEPRGSEVFVGGLLLEPYDKSAAAGVIFFNNTGYLGMCGHGSIGLVATLAHMGRITEGLHLIETPVGTISATLHPDGAVSIENVASFRKAKGVTVHTPNLGAVTGDVAWGGNWFFLVERHGLNLSLKNVEELTAATWEIRQAINQQGFPEVDHVELFSTPTQPGAHSRNFVLCPGKAYDRSPCGTGTSAKLACLAADGKLKPGETWMQESIIGTLFRGRYRNGEGGILPTISGHAYVNAESTFILNETDPFCWGIR